MKTLEERVKILEEHYLDTLDDLEGLDKDIKKLENEDPEFLLDRISVAIQTMIKRST